MTPMRSSQVENCGAAGELPEPGVGEHVGLLHQLLDLGLVADEATGWRGRGAVVPAHQQLEDLDVAREHPVDERLVGGTRLECRGGSGAMGTWRPPTDARTVGR